MNVAPITARPVAHSQAPRSAMSRFTCALEKRTGLRFANYMELHAFSVSAREVFWDFTAEWFASELALTGRRLPVCVGERCEDATFFPDARLNYAHSLLNDIAAPGHMPAVCEYRADGSSRTWTRSQLRADVERLASTLQEAGVREGDRVAAVMRNDQRAIVAALAVAALGATLATASPDFGLDALLDRFTAVRPSVLIAHCAPEPFDAGSPLQDKIDELLWELQGVRVLLRLDGCTAEGRSEVRMLDLDDVLAAASAGPFEWKTFPFNHPLFIMFSSGTTGKPKCMVHGAGGTLLEHVKEHQLHTGLAAGDRLYFHTSCGWMMWNWQLSALASGVEIVTYPDTIDRVDRLWQLVARQRVSVFGTSPAYLRMSQEAGIRPHSLGLEGLRAVLSTGAVLHDAQFAWVRSHVKDVPVQTISGGTDIIGCFVLGHPDLPVHDGEAQCLSLGLDVQSWRRGRPAPGVGELVCASPFPSRPLGFLDDDRGTRFHDAYFSKNPGVWTHGDLIEITPHGGARMHGRSDGVLNVRGIKIAPIEIERVIASHPAVRECMVVQSPVATGGDTASSEPQMVALVVLAPGHVMNADLVSTLRRDLARRLSTAHVPDRLFDVSELPVTHNGKLSGAAARAVLRGEAPTNQSALRNPESLVDLARRLETDGQCAPASADHAQPRALREQLRIVWEHHLGVHPIGPDMDFFELGGNSLMAARMLHAIREQTGVALPLATLLRAPTLSRLAALIERGATAGASRLVPLRAGKGAPIFLIHGLSGTVMECQRLVRSLHTDRPVWGLQAAGLDGEAQPLRRVEDMADLYVRDVRMMQPKGPYVIWGFSFGGLIAYEMAQRLAAAGQVVQQLGLLDTLVDRGFGWSTRAALGVANAARRIATTPPRQLPTYLRDRVTHEAQDAGAWLRTGIRVHEADRLGLAGHHRQVYEALVEAQATYRPKAGPPVPALLVRASPPWNQYFNSARVWRDILPGLQEVEVPGDHLDLVGRNALAVARRLDAAIHGLIRSAETEPYQGSTSLGEPSPRR